MKIVETQINDFKTQIASLPKEKHSLLKGLELCQAMFGYIPLEIQELLATEWGVSNAHIHGVVSFYELFYRVPSGKHTIGICKGTACHIEKSASLRTSLEETLGISEYETTKDEVFTLIPVKCLGLCDHAPAMIIDDQTYTKLTTQKLKEILKSYR